jgi:hypothetical protein
MSTDTEATAAAGRKERIERIEALLPAIALIDDKAYHDAVVEIWAEAWEESEWTDLADVPKGVYAPPIQIRSLVEHVNGVTEGAVALADAMREVHGWSYDRDLLLTAALLHDTSKVVESAPGPDGYAVMSKLGRLLQHGVLTAQRVLERDLGLELAHMIVSHTPMSKSIPANLEGIALFYADMFDSDTLSVEAGLPLLIRK